MRPLFFAPYDEGNGLAREEADEGAECGGEPEEGLVSIGNGGEGPDEEKQEGNAEPRGESPEVMGETMVSEEDGEHGVGEALVSLFLHIAAGAAGTDAGDASRSHHGTEHSFHRGGADVGVHGADVRLGDGEPGIQNNGFDALRLADLSSLRDAEAFVQLLVTEVEDREKSLDEGKIVMLIFRPSLG